MNDARFNQMIHSLAGQPMPALPEIPGRVFKAPRDNDDDPGLHDFEHARIWRDLASFFTRATAHL